jgi:hypothetical protein
LQKEIEETNDWTYNNINNGVYKSGFATTQEAYNKAVTTLFKSLDRVEKHLSENEGPFYFGKEITEADVRLYTTIVRFDVVYVQHFKVCLLLLCFRSPPFSSWLTLNGIRRTSETSALTIRTPTNGSDICTGTTPRSVKRQSSRISRTIIRRAIPRLTSLVSHRWVLNPRF